MQKRKTVMVFGTFDFFHAGHLFLLQQAKQLGAYLIVVVGRDKTVKKVKGKLPIHSEQERKKILQHINLVDQVVLGSRTNVYDIIKKKKPTVIALGYDQTIFVSDLLKKLPQLSPETKIIRLLPYKKKYKSRQIKFCSDSLTI